MASYSILENNLGSISSSMALVIDARTPQLPISITLLKDTKSLDKLILTSNSLREDMCQKYFKELAGGFINNVYPDDSSDSPIIWKHGVVNSVHTNDGQTSAAYLHLKLDDTSASNFPKDIVIRDGDRIVKSIYLKNSKIYPMILELMNYIQTSSRDGLKDRLVFHKVDDENKSGYLWVKGIKLSTGAYGEEPVYISHTSSVETPSINEILKKTGIFLGTEFNIVVLFNDEVVDNSNDFGTTPISYKAEFSSPTMLEITSGSINQFLNKIEEDIARSNITVPESFSSVFSRVPTLVPYKNLVSTLSVTTNLQRLNDNSLRYLKKVMGVEYPDEETFDLKSLNVLTENTTLPNRRLKIEKEIPTFVFRFHEKAALERITAGNTVTIGIGNTLDPKNTDWANIVSFSLSYRDYLDYELSSGFKLIDLLDKIVDSININSHITHITAKHDGTTLLLTPSQELLDVFSSIPAGLALMVKIEKTFTSYINEVGLSYNRFGTISDDIMTLVNPVVYNDANGFKDGTYRYLTLNKYSYSSNGVANKVNNNGTTANLAHPKIYTYKFFNLSGNLSMFTPRDLINNYPYILCESPDGGSVLCKNLYSYIYNNEVHSYIAPLKGYSNSYGLGDTSTLFSSTYGVLGFDPGPIPRSVYGTYGDSLNLNETYNIIYLKDNQVKNVTYATLPTVKTVDEFKYDEDYTKILGNKVRFNSSFELVSTSADTRLTPECPMTIDELLSTDFLYPRNTYGVFNDIEKRGSKFTYDYFDPDANATEAPDIAFTNFYIGNPQLYSTIPMTQDADGNYRVNFRGITYIFRDIEGIDIRGKGFMVILDNNEDSNSIRVLWENNNFVVLLVPARSGSVYPWGEYFNYVYNEELNGTKYDFKETNLLSELDMVLLNPNHELSELGFVGYSLYAGNPYVRLPFYRNTEVTNEVNTSKSVEVTPKEIYLEYDSSIHSDYVNVVTSSFVNNTIPSITIDHVAMLRKYIETELGLDATGKEIEDAQSKYILNKINVYAVPNSSTSWTLNTYRTEPMVYSEGDIRNDVSNVYLRTNPITMDFVTMYNPYGTCMNYSFVLKFIRK